MSHCPAVIIIIVFIKGPVIHLFDVKITLIKHNQCRKSICIFSVIWIYYSKFHNVDIISIVVVSSQGEDNQFCTL